MSNGSSHEVTPQQHGPLALTAPEASQPKPEGRLGESWPIAIPEQVVGSAHTFEFPSPKNLSSLGAVGVITLDGSSDLTVDWTAPTPVPCMGTGDLKITFSPTKAGPQHAVMTLVTKWEDGHVERRTIQVTTQARAIDAVPTSEAGAGPVHASRKTAGVPKGPDRALMVDEKNDWDKVGAAYDHLMKEQHDGIQLVETESHKFKPRPAERSIWQDLAEIAFQLGTGAIGGVVAKFVASKVSKAVVNAEKAIATAQAGEAQIAAAEKQAVAARGDVVEERIAQQAVIASKVDNYANQSAAKHAKFAEGEIGALAGGAVLKVMTTTASEIRGPQDSGGGGGKESTDASTTSEDSEIGFFSDQYAMSNTLADDGSARLSSVLAEQLKGSPEIAPQVMEGIVEGLREAISGEQAKKQQALNTSTQFMTYLARTNLGVEKIKTPQGAETVTDMSGQRSHGASLLESASLATGVLEIVCDQRGGSIHVADARAKNVSHLVVNRLLDVPLMHSGIPIRLSLNGGGTIITRDEAGRVRVSGLLNLDPPHTEEQQIGEAERIFHAVFAKTLKGWGVPQIHTNDATQGPDPSPKASKTP